MTDQVMVREVGPRDGLQLVKGFMPTDVKTQWIDHQVGSGCKHIEITSFVPPSVIPQFADATEVLEFSLDVPNLEAAVLVPNLKGGQIAFSKGAKKIIMVLSASESHNLANVRRTTEESISEFGELIQLREKLKLTDSVQISCAISTTFGCSIEGAVDESRVLHILEKILRTRCDEVVLCDTVGYANPDQVKRMFIKAQRLTDDIPLAAHFHDTRGMGIANVFASCEAGIRRFDASLGGLGGCPFAPGATGNIATEDCVYLLENLGLSTGIDLSALLETRQKLTEWLPNEQLHGKLLNAGLAKSFITSA
ncbi:MAG: hydroxymethylglutaryl-CoA lyase [Gammaproteobacteria bacterium]|nr:hydroxymethylglutaryl-CoA lyase [Gammaproteobacteria bacterium]